MKDLRVYYITEGLPISTDFDREIERLAKRYGLKFQGSGVEIATTIRDIHYAKEGNK